MTPTRSLTVKPEQAKHTEGRDGRIKKLQKVGGQEDGSATEGVCLPSQKGVLDPLELDTR